MGAELQAVQRDQRFLLVRAGGVCYGIAADQVRHLVRGLTCHPLPGSNPRLLGLAQFGGEPLAVLDLHALAEGGPALSGQWVTVILGRGDRDSWSAIGLAVDEALRVEVLDRQPSGGRGRRLVQGVVELGDCAVKVLDTSLLLADGRQGGGGDDD
jgi:chemotaxis signal transduction protein